MYSHMNIIYVQSLRGYEFLFKTRQLACGTQISRVQWKQTERTNFDIFHSVQTFSGLGTTIIAFSLRVEVLAYIIIIHPFIQVATTLLPNSLKPFYIPS
jgi:hypothetical protein